MDNKENRPPDKMQKYVHRAWRAVAKDGLFSIDNVYDQLYLTCDNVSWMPIEEVNTLTWEMFYNRIKADMSDGYSVMVNYAPSPLAPPIVIMLSDYGIFRKGDYLPIFNVHYSPAISPFDKLLLTLHMWMQDPLCEGGAPPFVEAAPTHGRILIAPDQDPGLGERLVADGEGGGPPPLAVLAERGNLPDRVAQRNDVQ